ncbi:hypothetical protein EDEG_00164 [Edhazardia aedis USNM 41457]|uniref:Uncharacterized protein n=1 Tax=Edhazardia aedis (strain USNM 41457) TaxID=1003232 RepID=J9D7C0_EDHAE|nr:hypothetical protein EDEG_00164 [Edhazardia aedis USNM 41457]|eukprot:EJW03676.1 hypothetical protein EDEG_00164 [Edhazardia aedis USNM 41457]
MLFKNFSHNMVKENTTTGTIFKFSTTFMPLRNFEYLHARQVNFAEYEDLFFLVSSQLQHFLHTKTVLRDKIPDKQSFLFIIMSHLRIYNAHFLIMLIFAIDCANKSVILHEFHSSLDSYLILLDTDNVVSNIREKTNA